jgi:glycosyltransferase involved in cell wall biosynthesis
MKIIYISDSIIPSKKANSVHVMKMSQALSDNGHSVTLICRKGGENLNNYEYYGVRDNFSIKKLYWPKIKGGGFVYGFLIKRFLNKKSLDSLVYGRCIYGVLLAAKKGFNCVFEAHTLPRNKIHFKMENSLFKMKGFKRLVVISKALADDYLNAFPELNPEKVFVAHDGADVPNEFFSEIKIEKGELSAGYVGSLYSGRGIEVIISLAKLFKKFTFHVVGGDDNMVDRLKTENKSLSNLFFYGHMPHKNICSYMHNFDVVLAPYQESVYTDYFKKNNTTRWMSPLKIFEYMSYGKAIISSDLTVIREILEDNVNSILCSPGKTREWEKALLLSEDSAFRERIGSKAREDFLKKYTWKKRASDVISGF